MAKHGLQARGLARRSKMIKAATYLFLEQGYEKTTTMQIASAAGMAQASFFSAFDNKEALLLELTKIMFSSQFHQAEAMDSAEDSLLLYGLKTGLQLHITELSESLRELYVTAYSLPSTSDYIYKSTTSKIMKIFGPYLPEFQENDFYELEIASGSVTRGYMSHPCNLYFTMAQKLRRHLTCCFRIYTVPESDYLPVIESVLQQDLRSHAQAIIADTIQRAEQGYEQVTTQKGE